MKCYDFGNLYITECRNELHKETYYHILPVINTEHHGRCALMLPDPLHTFTLHGERIACTKHLYELSFKCRLVSCSNGECFVWDDTIIGSYVYKDGVYHLTSMGNRNIHVYTGIDPGKKTKTYDFVDKKEYLVRYTFLDKKKGGK